MTWTDEFRDPAPDVDREWLIRGAYAAAGLVAGFVAGPLLIWMIG